MYKNVLVITTLVSVWCFEHMYMYSHDSTKSVQCMYMTLHEHLHHVHFVNLCELNIKKECKFFTNVQSMLCHVHVQCTSINSCKIM